MQGLGICHLHQHPGCAQLRSDIEEVEQVCATEYRKAKRRRLQQVVTTARHQAAADEGHVGEGIEEQQLAHRIAEQHLIALTHRRGGRAPHRGESFALA
ncbi:hypothetical protein D3C78_1708130 [compost metagenome]